MNKGIERNVRFCNVRLLSLFYTLVSDNQDACRRYQLRIWRKIFSITELLLYHTVSVLIVLFRVNILLCPYNCLRHNAAFINAIL
jgi:hypothetical protein